MTAIYNLTDGRIVEANDVPITFNFTNPDTGAYYDWTGVTKAWFCIKENHWDADTAALVLLNTVDDATQIKINYPVVSTGQAWVELADTDTVGFASKGALLYEFKVLKSGKINTLVQGEIVFLHGRIEATS